MLNLIAIIAVIVGLIAIKASARTIAIILTITTVVVLGTANAHAAAPGLGACGECTSNIVGLSADYFIALILAVICVVATVLVIRDDKKNK